MAIKNREAAARNPRGGARRGAGRPLGRTDTVPRKGTASEKDRFQALQFEYGKLLKENERLRSELQYGAKFNGTIEEMFLASARGEYVPTQMQAYTGKVILDRQPVRNVAEQDLKAALAERESAREEFDEWVEAYVRLIAHETACRLVGKPSKMPGPALVIRIGEKVLAEYLEEGDSPAETGHQPAPTPQHGRDTPQKPPQIQYVGPRREDVQSAHQQQPQRQQNCAAQPQDAPASNGRDIKRYMFGLPHKAFWLGNKRYDSNEYGEIDVTDASPEDIEQLDRHGYRARR